MQESIETLCCTQAWPRIWDQSSRQIEDQVEEQVLVQVDTFFQVDTLFQVSDQIISQVRNQIYEHMKTFLSES
jgi:hypothetical protein